MEIKVEPVGKPIGKVFEGYGLVLKRQAQILMGQARVQVKAEMRRQIGAALTPRAGLLITDSFYEDGLVGYLHSRWFRGPRGGKLTRGTGRLGANDILLSHATPGGMVIRPARAKSLLIINTKVIGRKPFRQQFNRDSARAAFGRKTRFNLKPSGNGGTLISQDAPGKRKGAHLATLVRSVRIPQAIDMESIRKQARQLMLARFANVADLLQRPRP